MAAYNKFNLFTQDLCRGSHNLQSGGHTFNVMLTNTAPVAANHLYSDVSGTELANGGGYTTGGLASAMSDTSASGTEKVLATNVTWTGSGAGTGPFRYVVIYNATQTTPLKPLVCWFDYGSSIPGLNPGDTFAVTFDATNGLFQLT
jgi:hypothetical protein